PNFPDNPSSPPCLPTEFHLAQYDLARRWFLRLFELEVGFDPSAAIPAHRRPHLARGLAIYLDLSRTALLEIQGVSGVQIQSAPATVNANRRPSGGRCRRRDPIRAQGPGLVEPPKDRNLFPTPRAEECRWPP